MEQICAPVETDDPRTSRSLIKGQTEIPPGSWWCLTCPAAAIGLKDPLTPAREHNWQSGHPTWAHRSDDR